MRVFGALNETDNSPEMEAINAEISPIISAASDEIMMNPQLFAKVKSVYDRRNDMGLSPAGSKMWKTPTLSLYAPEHSFPTPTRQPSKR